MNLRYELRAYEATNACRLAALLMELTTGNGSAVARDAVAELWAERHPRHAEQTGKKSVRSRITNGLVYLKVAQIARSEGDDIVIVNSEWLGLSAANLAIVQDPKGMAVTPALWFSRPAVPEHLQAEQEPLERRRLAAVERTKET